MTQLVENLKRERAAIVREKYADKLPMICDKIRKNGVYYYRCPNDCDQTANGMVDFLRAEGFNVKRIMWHPGNPSSYTKELEVTI